VGRERDEHGFRDERRGFAQNDLGQRDEKGYFVETQTNLRDGQHEGRRFDGVLALVSAPVIAGQRRRHT